MKRIVTLLLALFQITLLQAQAPGIVKAVAGLNIEPEYTTQRTG